MSHYAADINQTIEELPTELELDPFIRLAGSTGATEVLRHIYTACPSGTYKPQGTKALQHLIHLGYLKPDYQKGIVFVCHEDRGRPCHNDLNRCSGATAVCFFPNRVPRPAD